MHHKDSPGRNITGVSAASRGGVGSSRNLLQLSLLVFLASMLLSRGVAGAGEWTVTTSDFQSRPVVLKGLAVDGLHVASTQPSGDDIIPADRFVSAQRTSNDGPQVPKFTLVLVGGDRLVGEPTSVANEKLSWANPLLGKVSVPFGRLAAIVRGTGGPLPDEPPKQDVATLSNGDAVAGVFTDCVAGKLTIQGDAGPTVVPLENIARVLFAATPAAASDSVARAFRLRLNDGSVVTAEKAVTEADRLKITLPGKTTETVELPIADLLSIEQLNGPVRWLSSRVPSESLQIPYVGGAPVWTARFDSAVDGGPLQVDGHIFDRGIGVHAYSRLRFPIDPQWTAFRTQYAMDSRRDHPSKFADVTVRIKIDGKTVHEQMHVREGQISPVVRVDLKEAKSLELECDYGAAGDTQARLDWLQPALIRGR